MFTDSKQLREPLLSLDESNHEIKTLDESEPSPSCTSSGMSLSDRIILWVILPSLLVAQFYMALNFREQPTLDFMSVNICIALFVCTCTFYRMACYEAGIKNCFVLLLPELFMDIILGLVLFREAVIGFLVLNASMMVLSLFVIVHDVRRLLQERSECSTESKLEPEGEITIDIV